MSRVPFAPEPTPENSRVITQPLRDAVSLAHCCWSSSVASCGDAETAAYDQTAMGAATI